MGSAHCRAEPQEGHSSSLPETDGVTLIRDLDAPLLEPWGQCVNLSLHDSRSLDWTVAPAVKENFDGVERDSHSWNCRQVIIVDRVEDWS